MNSRICRWVSIFFFSLALQALPAQAQTPASRVRGMLEEVMAVQKKSAGEGAEDRNRRRAAIKEIIARNFDFDSMSRKSLGRQWDKLSSSERAEFKSVFQGLFQDSYTKLVLNFLKQEKILYHQKEVNRDTALVKTTLVRVNEEIPVDYTLTRWKDHWLVGDVAIDGVSIADNYRQAFTRVIQRESFQSLLQRMRLQQQAIEKPS
jgi:phospholipid transport system substrate-binding protein